MTLPHLVTNLCFELQKGKFCYVLESSTANCRKLCRLTHKEMMRRDYRSILIDVQTSAIAWDQNIITAIWQRLHPQNEAWLVQWLSTTADLSSQQRLTQFADDLLLSDLCEGPLLIQFMNIDSLLKDSLTTQIFLDWVGYCYELRDAHLTYSHLSIVAFGSALPAAFLSQMAKSKHAVVREHTSRIVVFRNTWVPQLRIQEHIKTAACKYIAPA